MHSIQLPDDLYQQAQQRASEAGLSVDEYIAEIVESDVNTGSENYDHLFTPEVVAELEQIHAEMKAGGKVLTPEEVDEFLRQKSLSWRGNHGN
jgi:hypothetical protein